MILDRLLGLGSSNRRARGRRDFSLDATRTDRLNADHWADATDEPINALISRTIKELRARCRHEFVNNPLVKGVVKTYGDDFVGPAGPSLAVQSDDDGYNTALEQIWKEWWAAPDVNGMLSGADVLRLSSTSVWTTGDYLWQIVNDDRAPTPLQTRIMVIHSRRLSTPYDLIADDDVVMGIRRTRTGKPVTYYIQEGPRGENLGRFSMEYAQVPAEAIVHGFEVLEPDQARGLPWLQPALSVVAQLRDYDEQVLQAARMAAALAVLLFTKDPANPTDMVNEITDLEPGTMSTLPPGYEATQVQPAQPASTYVDFRHERLRELGRPVGMPLMAVTLDAKGHSWSSARLDRDVYHSGLQVERGHTQRAGLNRLVDAVRREAELTRMLRPAVAATYKWTWNVFTSIDPMKEAKAATERLGNGTSTLARECAALGEDWEEIIEQRAREIARLKEKGLRGIGTGEGQPANRRPQRTPPAGDNGKGSAAARRLVMTDD